MPSRRHLARVLATSCVLAGLAGPTFLLAVPTFLLAVPTFLLAVPTFLLAVPAGAATPPSADGAWARAPIGAAGAMALYMTLHGGAAADRLVSVDSDVAGMAMLHESTEQGGISSMRMLDGVDLPAGATVRLAPGGMHVMLEDLRTRPAPGQTIHVTLRFQHAPPSTIAALVRPAGASAP